MSHEPRPEQRSRSRIGCAGATLVALAILTLLAAFLFYRMEMWPRKTAQALRDAIAEITQVKPQVTVNNRVFFEQTAPVLELAVVSRPTQVERELQHEWLGSTKRIKLRGTYEVRAGFDLTKPFTVRLEDNKRLIVEVPPPRILSVDQKDAEVLAMDSGLWNKIKAADLEGELNSLPLLARKKATETGLQKEALESLKKQIVERFGSQYEVEVVVSDPMSNVPRLRD
jgi:hypothetical protein